MTAPSAERKLGRGIGDHLDALDLVRRNLEGHGARDALPVDQDSDVGAALDGDLLVGGDDDARELADDRVGGRRTGLGRRLTS